MTNIWDPRVSNPTSDDAFDVERALTRMAQAIAELQTQATRGLPAGFNFRVVDGSLYLYDTAQARRALLTPSEWESTT